MLDAQSAGPIRLVLWNNRPANSAAYEREIRDFKATGSLASIELHTSRANVGGMGRFYVIKHLRRDGLSGPVILLDDDQDIDGSFVHDLLASYTPESVHGVWAWRQTESYWHREQLTGEGEATYLGTGGTILNSTIVDDERFFTVMPRKYFFLEDIWMNFVAEQHGWRLFHANARYEFVEDTKGQHLHLADLKREFWAYLRSAEARTAWDRQLR
ncbi:hypothetical protein ACEXQD_06455 [Herbiconiux sp. P15]|uniref:hypothetical protein n=1 Tax=Herbiconiux liukaitaii TaxID=3342799 RepID=UPI0035B8F848